MQVSVQALGTMMFGAIGEPDPVVCRRLVDIALEHGMNLIDTADMYGAGESEELVGKALEGRRDDVVLATKAHFPVGDDGPNRSGNARRWLLRAVEGSLRRLRTDWIDLYQVHRPDPATDVEETLATLTDLVRAGTIRAFGCSTFPAAELVEAHHVAERRGLQRFRSEQPPYSLLLRGIERDVLPTCERLGLGVLTWSPLAWGFLSGRHRRDRPAETTGRAALDPRRFDPASPETAPKYDAVEQLAAIAEEAGLTLPELALAFPPSHPAVTSVILGPRTEEQLRASLAAASVTLDDATLDRIDAVVPPGTDVYANEGAWTPPALREARLRRRPLAERAAA